MKEREKTENMKAVLEECRKRGVTIEDLLELIDKAIDPNHSTKNEKKNLELRIAKYLRKLGIPASLDGYKYLKFVFLSAIEDREILSSITHKLYPYVAKEFNTTPTKVERGIRHAIEVAWSRGDVEILEMYFGNTVDSSRGKPTNHEFIATTLENILLCEI